MNAFETALRAGSQLETVLLGGWYGGCILIWRASGQGECRRIKDESVIQHDIAQGVFTRAAAGSNRFREVALLDAASDTLLFLAGNSVDSHPEFTIEGEATHAPIVALPTPPDIPAWTEWGRWLGAMSLCAAARGEYIVVERGGWSPPEEPYVLLGVVDPEGTGWQSFAEAKPAPDFDPWPSGADGKGGSTLTAPPTEEVVRAGGLLAVQAISMWAQSPLDVGLTFGLNPVGAWEPRD